MELDRIDKILDRIATPYKVDKNTWGWLPIIDAQKKLALQAIEAYIAEREKKAYIQGGVDEILRHEKASEAVLKEMT